MGRGHWALLLCGASLVAGSVSFPPVSNPLTFHNSATRTAFNSFYWPDNYMRHRNSLYIQCAHCVDADTQKADDWLQAENASPRRHLLATISALFAANRTTTPDAPCHVLWLGASPTAVHAEAFLLLHIAGYCPSAVMVTADPDPARSSFGARYHATATAEELCGVHLGKSAFHLVVLDHHDATDYVGRRASLAAALRCVTGSLGPSGRVLLFSETLLTDEEMTAGALQATTFPSPLSTTTAGDPSPLAESKGFQQWVHFYRRREGAKAPDAAPQKILVKPLRPANRITDVRLASCIRCGQCGKGHGAIGAAYLDKAAKVFGLAKDRQILERDILSAFRRAAFPMLLFAGVQPYTQKYVNYFLRNGSTVFATAELMPRGAIYGAEPHYQGPVNVVRQLVPPSTFDGLLAHGILGHGIDDEKDVRDFFAVAQSLIRPGGWLYLGYHMNPHAPRNKPRSVGHGFANNVFVPTLNGKGFVTASFAGLPAQHCFKNTVPGVTRNLKFCCEFWRKREA